MSEGNENRARRRIVVAMSGGVDSSVTAALLVEAGHEVIGVSMRTHLLPAKSNRACCTPDDMRDARAVAGKLGIPFYLLPYEDHFAREVVAPFVAAYRAGRTPNPCIVCNDRIKFAPLLQQARELGAAALATGHYARIGRDLAGHYTLLRARDRDKDQSYFLYRLQQHQLAQLVFPLGDLTKSEVRAHALRLGLGRQVADKAESQEICFVGPKGYRALIEAEGQKGAAAAGQPLIAAKEPGQAAARGQGPSSARTASQSPMLTSATRNELVDPEGRVLGHHGGVHHFTIGQRRGLGVATKEPLFVVAIDPRSGQVTLGPRPALLCDSLKLTGLSATGPALPEDVDLEVQLRHRGRSWPVHIGEAAPASVGASYLEIRFTEPTERSAPGQAAVLYQGDRVLGGGVVATDDELGLGATADVKSA